MPNSMRIRSGRSRSVAIGLFAAAALALAGCGSGGAVDGGGAGANLGGGPPPPAPPGPETGATPVLLSWDANTEPDLDGYRLYYGVAPGTYQNVLDVGNVTTATVTSLQPGTRYFFAVTAYDVSGNESGFSNEVFKDVL